MLATSSASNRPHAVGLLLYAAVRKYPFAPPMAVQFQGIGEVLAVDDPHIMELLDAGRLKRIAGYGAMNEPGICFIKITPPRRIATYDLGILLLRLMRDVSQGARSVELP